MLYVVYEREVFDRCIFQVKKFMLYVRCRVVAREQEISCSTNELSYTVSVC